MQAASIREAYRRHLEKGVVRRATDAPLMSPPECMERLRQLGFRGQEAAAQAACVMAYRHGRKIRRMAGGAGGPAPARDNYLFIGPTGSGKTFLVELLCEIQGVPCVITDMSQYSETGYVGEKVGSILTRLVEAAGGDLAWAQCGVVALDEFDKLAASSSNARFAGAGTTKDVSGYGVQRGLLTLLSALEYPRADEYGCSTGSAIDLSRMTFVACGAFTGLGELAAETGRRIGFEGLPTSAVQYAAPAAGQSILENTAAFTRYGFLPELIGRFSRLVLFEPLGADVLRQILCDTVIEHYRDEFSDEGHELYVDEAALDALVAAALRRQTGARGLQAALRPYLEEAAFQCFGLRRPRQVRLRAVGESVRVEVSP